MGNIVQALLLSCCLWISLESNVSVDRLICFVSHVLFTDDLSSHMFCW